MWRRANDRPESTPPSCPPPVLYSSHDTPRDGAGPNILVLRPTCYLPRVPSRMALSAPVTESELAHRETVGPATGVTVGSEDLFLVLLRLDVLLPLLLAVAVLAAEPAVVPHLHAQLCGCLLPHLCPLSAPPGCPPNRPWLSMGAGLTMMSA